MDKTIYKFEEEMLKGGSININKKSDSHWYKKHWHNYYELIYFSGCNGYCILNGEKFSISGNCLFLLTPKDFHEIYTDERDGAYSLIISFNGNMADSHILETVTQSPLVSYNIPHSLTEKLDELYKKFNFNGKYSSLYVKHLFNCILLDIIDIADKVKAFGNDLNPIVAESISIMLSSPTSALSLDFFAKKFNITPSYFSGLFHSNTGISFKRYLTALRLEYARQLLDENRLSIIDIGYECGFNTPSQFYRAFKSECGITPSEYRKTKINSI